MSSASLAGLVEAAEAVRATDSRLEKRDRAAAYLRTLAPDDVALAVRYLAGEIPQGRLGLGWRTLAAAADRPQPRQTSLFEPSVDSSPLTLAALDAGFSRLRDAAGPGAGERRRSILHELMARTGCQERAWIFRLVGGEVRQGALRAVVVEAAAAAFEIPEEPLRRAIMVSGDFGEVARAVARRGAAALADFDLVPLRPIEPMLASTAPDVRETVRSPGRAAVEWKVDGIRVQVHRAGGEVRIFSRRLRDLTAALGPVAELARALPARDFVLDGEIVGRDARGAPVPFQRLMSAISREADAAAVADDEVRLEALFFDLLHLDGEGFLERPYRERIEALDRLVPAERRVPRRIVGTGEEARAVHDEALAAGHEGVVVKALDAPYRAGRRGAHWRKVKPAVTVDLVILAAEWGSGRRRGRLSNLHLGARVPGSGFAMLGKTFKGLTDEMLAELTRDLPAIATRRDAHTVHVEPRRVVEIAFDGVQRSSRYASGLALRFARVKRFRPDKRAEEATTLDEIRAVRERQDSLGSRTLPP